jgi:hypothetical protein
LELDVEDLARLAGAPSTFFCTICMEVMRDPVLLPTGKDGGRGTGERDTIL